MSGLSHHMVFNSYRQSVSNTNKIARALRNPSVFKLCPNAPMFETEPSMMRKKMNVTSFHLSQVGGHTPKMKKRNNGGATKRRGHRKASQTKAIDDNWRLDPAQEEERMELFGYLPRSSCREYENKGKEFPSSLKRKYLNARSQSVHLRLLHKEKEKAITMGAGKSSAILQRLEKSYANDSDDVRERLGSIGDTGNNSVVDLEKPSDSFDSINDCRSVNFGSDRSYVVDEGNTCPTTISQACDNGSCGALDDIFGPSDEVGSGVGAPRPIDPLQLAGLFDTAVHQNCAVIAPPGMELDDSDEESESSESSASTSSDMSMNDDVCAFFEKSNSGLGVESYRNSNDDDERLTLKTPCSDQGSDHEFGGADDNLEFGTPREMENNADPRSPNIVAEASKRLESTLVIGEGNDLNNSGPGESVTSAGTVLKSANECERRMNPVNEKENIDIQLSLSPVHKEDQSTSDLETRNSPKAHDPSQLKEKSGPSFQSKLWAENDNTYGATGVDSGAVLQLDDENTAELADHAGSNLSQEGAQSPIVMAFQLPTPPPSSEESDSSDEESAEQNTTKDNLDEVDAVNPVHHMPDHACQSNQFEICEDLSVGNAVSDNKEASFFQLPTQYSSSEEDDDDDNDEEEEKVSSELNDDRPPDARTNEVETVAHTSAAIQNQHDNVPERGLADSESKHVHFKPTYFEDLTESPIKPSHSALKRTGGNSRMSPDDLTDSPIKNYHSANTTSAANPRLSLDNLTDTPIKPSFSINMKRIGANSRMSLESLADTPLPCRKNAGLERKSLDSLSDTPLPRNNNAGKLRKRLRVGVSENEGSTMPEPGTTDKVQRKDRVKKRIEEKYRCRFLDCEAANDDSEESDEEDAIKQIEDEEMSQ